MTRVLFVDDEPAIRETLPAVLRQHGYAVEVAATVPEALATIAAEQFDVLITDLNIGNPGDGFTVVSAMRRTHPKCITLILTGYPGLETALEAIRSQVDDYLIKPAHPKRLIETIEQKLREPFEQHIILTKRLSTVLREKSDELKSRALAMLKADSETAALSLSDEERIALFSKLIEQIAEVLESSEPVAAHREQIASALSVGRMRLEQGYTVPLMVTNLRIVESVIYDLVNENLLALNLSYLIIDLKKLNETLHRRLEQAMKAFAPNARNAA